MEKENVFEKIMLFGIRNCNSDKASGIGKVFIIQLLKAIPIGLVAFLLSLIFCSFDHSIEIGLIFIIAFGLGGMGVLD